MTSSQYVFDGFLAQLTLLTIDTDCTSRARHNVMEGGPGVVGVSISYTGPKVRKGSNFPVPGRGREGQESAHRRHPTCGRAGVGGLPVRDSASQHRERRNRVESGLNTGAKR
jgi:hypothetical protein